MPNRRAFAVQPAAAAALALLASAGAAGDWPPLAYTVSDGARIEAPLTRAPGDPARGAAIAADPARGGCDGCHGTGGAAIGASDPAALRLWIVNAAILRPALTDHAFYDLSEADPGAPTRLTAQAVEDLVAHLTARAR